MKIQSMFFFDKVRLRDPRLLALGFSLLMALSFLMAAMPAYSATYYVSPSGNNANSGLSLSYPLRTIQAGVDKAVAGDTVYVRAGIYRESVNVWKNGGAAGKMITVRGYNGEVPIIKGSDVVTGWTYHSGSIYKKTGWAANSQQVFVDFNNGAPGLPLKQIGMPSSLYTTYEYPKPLGSGVSSMVPGSFYYDKYAKTLYVWLPDGSSPNSHYMEASTRPRLFFMGKPYIYLKGFAFRHSNSSATYKQGSAVELSSNSVIDQCDIQAMDFAGLSMGYQQWNTQAINCNVSNNGAVGISAAASYNFRVAYTTLKKNNYRDFNKHWHSGGIKGTSDAHGTIEHSEASWNNASGIWFDYCDSNKAIVIRNNYVHHNGPLEAGIFIEVSNAALIYNNIVANNTRRGIYIAASNNNRVYNNTVYGTAVYAAIEVNGMPRSGATLTGNAVTNNIISHSSSKYDLSIAKPNGSSVANNTSNNNDFYRPGAAIQMQFGPTIYTTLTSWISASGQDRNSFTVNPVYVSAAPDTPGEFRLAGTSTLLNRATSLAAVPHDYAKASRPAGSAYDIGAYELVSSTTTSSSSSSSYSWDTVDPWVSVRSPSTEGTKVSGSVSVTGAAGDNAGIAMMKLYIDGVLKSQAAKTSIAYPWDTSRLASGSAHYIMISAVDYAGNQVQTTRKVYKQ